MIAAATLRDKGVWEAIIFWRISSLKKISINGSIHREGALARKLKVIGLPVVHLADGIPAAVTEILKARVVVFATPVLWFNVSALMKGLLEALPDAPKYPCEGKVAYLFALGNEDGGQQAVNQMFAPLSHMGFQFPPYASQFINTSIKGKSEARWQDNAPVTTHPLRRCDSGVAG